MVCFQAGIVYINAISFNFFQMRQAIMAIRCRLLTCLGRFYSSLRYLTPLLIGLLIGLGLYRFGALYDQVQINLKINMTSTDGYDMSDFGSYSYDDMHRPNNQSEFVVPNIVHFIWFGKDHVLSFVCLCIWRSTRKS